MLRIIIFLLSVGIAHGADAPALDTTVVMEKARKEAETMTIPENPYNEKGKQAAEKASSIFRSQEFQDKVKCYEKQLKDSTPEAKRAAPEEKPVMLSESEKIYLFLSSSIPVEVVHSYLADLEGVPEIRPVLKGMVGGMQNTEKMADWLNQISKKEPACQDTSDKQCIRYEVDIDIDPQLFDQYTITEVPALVYVRGDESFQIQGDAGLDSLLEQINRELKNPGLTSLTAKIRGSR